MHIKYRVVGNFQKAFPYLNINSVLGNADRTLTENYKRAEV